MSFGDDENSESSPTSDQGTLADFVDSYHEGAESEEVDSNASGYIRTLPFGYEPPEILQHGRAYSSDEDGDGPSGTCIAFKRLVRLRWHGFRI